MLMERELNKGGKTDEKIQSIDGNAARGNRSVGRGGGRNDICVCTVDGTEGTKSGGNLA